MAKNRGYSSYMFYILNIILWWKCFDLYTLFKLIMLTCERGEYLSTQGSSWSLWPDSFSRWELLALPFLFLGTLSSDLEPKDVLLFLFPDREKFSAGKSRKDGSTQGFTYVQSKRFLKHFKGHHGNSDLDRATATLLLLAWHYTFLFFIYSVTSFSLQIT